MASTTTTNILLLLITLLTFTGDALSDHLSTTTTNLYLSPKTLTTNYNNMLNSFKIFIYQTPPSPPPQEHSLFYKSLINSHFITEDPNQAHLFFIPFNPSISTRSLARVIKNIRTNHPFWNRTLGADHFYLTTSEGVDLSSDRNIVELKKNSIQISSFPTSYGSFIPHKDITLPHVLENPKPKTLVNDTKKDMFLGYMRLSKDIPLSLSEDIKKSEYFTVEHGPMDSKFCLFSYHSDVSWIVEALASRCVPVVITDRPIQDLPLMDVIKWDEIAVFVGPNSGAHGIVKVLEGIEDSRYEMMVESGVLATEHLAWNEEPKPYDAFHMIVYQLWLRRHTVRYARWVEY